MHHTTYKKNNKMKAKEIKIELLKGAKFENEKADWFVVNKDGYHIIVKEGRYFFYKTINSLSIRIAQLINRGY